MFVLGTLKSLKLRRLSQGVCVYSELQAVRKSLYRCIEGFEAIGNGAKVSAKALEIWILI